MPTGGLVQRVLPLVQVGLAPRHAPVLVCKLQQWMMRKGGTEDQLIPGYTDTIDVNSHIGEFMRAFPD